MSEKVQSNSPLRKIHSRRQTALAYWEDRLTKDDKFLLSSVKKFQDKTDVPQKEIDKYREFMKIQIKTLKGRVSA